MKWRRWVGLLLLLSLTAAMLQAQRYRRSGFYNLGFFDQAEPPDTEFVFARWHYGTGPYGGDGWAHDYPTAEEHILQVLKETTVLNVDRLSYRVVELSSPEIFKYPFSYISEPGEMQLTDEEVVNFREYIDRGGFVMVDDFGGQSTEARELAVFRENMSRVFPDRDWFLLPEDHPVLNSFYDIDDPNTIHPMTGVKSVFWGFPDGKGGLSMVICFRNDVGDFWEYIDEPQYPLKPSAEALKLGINFVIYAMTH